MVTHICDVTPRYLRMSRNESLAQFICSLTNYHRMIDNTSEQDLIRSEFFVRKPVGTFQDSVYSTNHVL